MIQRGTTNAVPIGGEEWVLLVRATPGEDEDLELHLDRQTLADLVLEGIEEAQRTRGAQAQTTWFDAAQVADLIRFHVTRSADDPR